MTDTGPDGTPDPGRPLDPATAPVAPTADHDAARTRRTGVIVGAVAVILAVIVVGAILLLGGDDAAAPDGSDTTTVATTAAPATTEPAVTTEPTETTAAPETTGPPETTEPEPTTTTAPPTTAPVDPVDPVDPVEVALWPWVDSDLRFDDPLEAARSFAADVLGFEDPIVGEFLGGDLRSGEVEVRSIAPFTPTTVLVRQLTDDDSWWVIGSVSENLLLELPEPGDTIGDPLLISARTVAWEGTVEVKVRVDGEDADRWLGFFTGPGAPGEPGEVQAVIPWDPPTEGWGTLILFTQDGAKTGEVLEGTAIRVRFGTE